MIKEVSGDLLLSKAQVIAHGVAPNDPFHTGLALQLREQWPAMYKDFRHYCKQQNPKPGTLWLWQGVDQTGRHVRFAALLTQEAASREGGHGGRAHTEYVNHALHELQKLLQKLRPKSWHKRRKEVKQLQKLMLIGWQKMDFLLCLLMLTKPAETGLQEK